MRTAMHFTVILVLSICSLHAAVVQVPAGQLTIAGRLATKDRNPPVANRMYPDGMHAANLRSQDPPLEPQGNFFSLVDDDVWYNLIPLYTNEFQPA